jgi:hypothetical protein
MPESEQDMHHAQHPQSDGTVKRYIKMVKEQVWKVLTSHQRMGTQNYPSSSLLKGPQLSDTTGLTPASLVFGREFQLPCDLQFGAPPNKERPTIDVANVVDHLHDIHNYAD